MQNEDIGKGCGPEHPDEQGMMLNAACLTPKLKSDK